MPSKTEKQRRFFGAQYNRAKRGLPTSVSMTTAEIKEFLTKEEPKKTKK